MVSVAPDNWKQWNPSDPIWSADALTGNIDSDNAILRQRAYVQGNSLYNTMFGDYVPEGQRRQWGNMYRPDFQAQPINKQPGATSWSTTPVFDDGVTKALTDLYGIRAGLNAPGAEMLGQGYQDQQWKSYLDRHSNTLDTLKNKLGYNDISAEQFARDWVSNYKPGEQVDNIYGSGLPGFHNKEQQEQLYPGAHDAWKQKVKQRQSEYQPLHLNGGRSNDQSGQPTPPPFSLNGMQQNPRTGQQYQVQPTVSNRQSSFPSFQQAQHTTTTYPTPFASNFTPFYGGSMAPNPELMRSGPPPTPMNYNQQPNRNMMMQGGFSAPNAAMSGGNASSRLFGLGN